MINADSEKRRKTLIRVHLSTSSEAERSVVMCYWSTVLEPSVRHCVATGNCMGCGSVGIFAYCRISLTVLSAIFYYAVRLTLDAQTHAVLVVVHAYSTE